MAESDAKRALRYRRHKAGDHSLCVEGRCPALTVPIPVEASPQVAACNATPVVAELGPRGTALWSQITSGGAIGPLQAVLLLEACRIADRLDRLDRQLRGEDWLRFWRGDDSAPVTVYVDKVLAESREQATALRGICVELARQMSNVPTKQEPTKQGVGIVDLAARVAARRQAKG